MDLNIVDNQLKLLSKYPILVNNIPVYPVSLNSIVEYGYSKYFKMLNYLCISTFKVNDIVESIPNGVNDDNLVFCFLMQNMLQNIIVSDDGATLRDIIIDGIKLICKTENVIFSEKHSSIFVNEYAITEDFFTSFQYVVKIRNGIVESSDISENPANEKAKELLKKRNQLRDKLKSKHNVEGDLTIADLISILSSGLKMKTFDIMDYDLYQFNNQFQRLSIAKEYDVNILALVHGAKSEDVKIQHWISKIKTNIDS